MTHEDVARTFRERYAANVKNEPGQQPVLGPEMSPRRGPFTYTGASGEKVTAPDYGAGRLPQPVARQRLDRPINQQTLDEMRAASPEPPPRDPRPINPETLAEMRANDPLGNGPLSQTDPLLSK